MFNILLTFYIFSLDIAFEISCKPVAHSCKTAAWTIRYYEKFLLVLYEIFCNKFSRNDKKFLVYNTVKAK